MGEHHKIKVGGVERHIAPLAHARSGPASAQPAAHDGPLPEPPPSANLRARCFPTRDQRPLASCVPHAVSTALRIRHAQQTGEDLPLSPLFLYWVTRTMIEGQRPDRNGTCKMLSVVEAVRRHGVCHEGLWPYEVDRMATAPSSEAFDDAALRTVVKARPLTTLRAIKLTLADGYPVPLAFTVARSVEDGEDGRTARTWETGTFPLPADDDHDKYDEWNAVQPPDALDHGIGVHAVLAIGYDDAARKVYVQNSWGPHFGDGGFGDLSYDFFGPHQDADLQSHTQPTMAYDAWVFHAQHNAPAPERASAIAPGQRNAPPPERPVKVDELSPGKVWLWVLETAGSGSLWRLESLPEGVVALGSRFEPPPGGGAGEAVGVEGKRYFDFDIAKPGTYLFTFHLVPAGGGAPIDTERFKIVITESED